MLTLLEPRDITWRWRIFNQPPPEPVRKRGSKLDKYKPDIDSWLEADKLERNKQRHTALRVFNRLKKKYGPDF